MNHLRFLKFNELMNLPVITSERKKTRILILADINTAQISPLINKHLNNIGLEGEFLSILYTEIEAQLLNKESELFKFKPDIVIILNSTQSLFQKIKIDKNETQDIIDKMQWIWNLILKQSSPIILQSNFTQSLERPFGQYEEKVPSSFNSVIKYLNMQLGHIAQTEKQIYILDFAYLSSLIGLRNWYDENLWYYSKTLTSLKNLPEVSAYIVDIIKAYFQSTIKCVVVDLDETLWGGILGDDGIDKIILNPEGEGQIFRDFQSYLLRLKERGILLAVASKNELSLVLEVFKQHPDMILKEEDITYFAVNWEPKSKNIAKIQSELNISFDSMVFIDDNPFERDIVKSFHPEINVPDLSGDPAKFIREISAYNYFETTSFTERDKKRSKNIISQIKSKSLSEKYSSFDEYLKDLDMSLEVSPFHESKLDRIVQLTQRSNQFNLTTKRYSHQEIKQIMSESNQYITFSLNFKDKLTDHGLISLIILKRNKDTLIVDQWLMSCRVFSRGIEQYMMNLVFAEAKKLNVTKIIGEYIPTQKNTLVENFYESFGFISSPPDSKVDDASSSWKLDVSMYKDQDHYINVFNKKES